MIEIYHLIYFRRGGNNPQYGRITYRKNWDFVGNHEKKKMSSFWIPTPLKEILDDKFDKWYYVPFTDLSNRFLEFTIGAEMRSDCALYAISVKHPNDNYDKKIGRTIVEGRIKRMKGEIKNREPYDLDDFYLVYKED